MCIKILAQNTRFVNKNYKIWTKSVPLAFALALGPQMTTTCNSQTIFLNYFFGFWGPQNIFTLKTQYKFYLQGSQYFAIHSIIIFLYDYFSLTCSGHCHPIKIWTVYVVCGLFQQTLTVRAHFEHINLSSAFLRIKPHYVLEKKYKRKQ